MVSANREMAVYCFDTLIAHYNSEQTPPPAFDEGQQKRILTVNNLRKRGMQIVNVCLCCMKAEESAEHLLIHCQFISHLWSTVFSKFNINTCLPQYPSDLLSFWHGIKFRKIQTRLWHMMLLAIWWSTWEERNNRCFNDKISSAHAIWKRATHLVVECPLFVTWKKAVNGGEPRLRGCIGTLEARCLINGFRDYALTSALRDRRFPPIQAKELPNLECTVSILTDYETALHYLDWEIGKHGLIIEFTDPDYNTRRSATYLPEVAAHEGWTKMETIDSLMRKAAYNGAITESLRKRVRLTRYQSTLYTMHYSDYASYVKRTRGTVPAVASAKPNH